MDNILEEFSLTDEQKEAVDIEKNIALSAGAGSGKTRVLTARYIHLLSSGVDIDSIVALTFTEKAALEMKERVMEAISDRIKTDTTNHNLWQRSLDKLGEANISTIHGFCASILRENVAQIGIDYNFGIIDEIEGQNVIDMIWDNLVSKYKRDDKFIEIIEDISEHMGREYSKDMLKKDILRTREFILEEGLSIDEFRENNRENSDAFYIIGLMSELDNIYMEYKLSRDVLDYNDLQTLCSKILSDADMGNRYRNIYKYFMIDEFQDTNEIQKKIIYSLVKKDNIIIPGRLFVVGDFKQSIYGFRGTDYRIFGKVQSELGDESNKSLKTCFRSDPELVYGINSIFKALIKPYEAMVPYGKQSQDPKDNLRIEFLEYSPQRTKTDEDMLIDELKKHIRSGEEDGGVKLDNILSKLRENTSIIQPMDGQHMGGTVVDAIDKFLDLGLEYGEISILVRSRALNNEIEEKLLEAQIPYNIVGGSSLYDSQEIKALMAIYELIIDMVDGNCNYLKLLEVLKGDLFNIPDDILFKVRKNQIEHELKDYWSAIKYSLEKTQDKNHRERLNYAYKTLNQLYDRSKYLNAYKLIEHIVFECKVIEGLIWQDNGEQKVRNIEKFLDLVKELDREKLLSPDDLIEHLKTISVQSGEEQGLLEAVDGQAVNIMTIHQSKGLEFDGVIIPGMERDLLYMSNRENAKRGFIKFGDKLIIRDAKSEDSEFAKHIHEQIQDELDEYIRLLYVAMTRAKKYVTLIGRDIKSRGDKLNTFSKMIQIAIEDDEDTSKWVKRSKTVL